jgi:DNA polymerase elongation subunit (family B)
MTETHPGVDDMLEKSYYTGFLSAANQTMTPNGALFTRNKHGFLPELMQKMYNDRKGTKKQMLQAAQKFEQTKDVQFRNVIPKLHNKQMALKIALNSAYGAVGNQYFRFYDIRIAEAVTYGGQLSIRWIEKALNGYFNEILETENEDYVIASDTDSVYITFEKLIEKLNPPDPVKFLDTICQEKIEPWIEGKYTELAEYVNAYEQKMVMSREVIADKGIWTAKKRYILNVHNSEGVQYAEPKLKMMGIEAVKSSTPQVCRDKIRDALKLIMIGDEKDLNDFIQEFRKEWMEMSPTAIAFPRSCNGIGKWSDPNGIYRKGSPMHVKGALIYNHQIKNNKLAKKYPLIQNGEKIRYVHLKNPNPYQCNAFTFITECPTELDIIKYVDYNKQFEKSYIEPLKFITNAINWHIDDGYGSQATLMDFFN